MLRIQKLTDYAIVVMTHLAVSPDQIHSATDLAAETHLELPTVSKILKQLAGAGLVRSFRGAQGGYSLVKSPAQISVANVITAMEGPIGMTECSIHDGLCAQESVCMLRSNWRRISWAIQIALDDVTLEDMTRPMQPPIDIKSLKLTTVQEP